MSFKSWLKKLEKRKIISRKPNPIIPFILTLIIFALWRIYININPNNLINNSLFCLFLFSLAFSIIHLIVAIELGKK